MKMLEAVQMIIDKPHLEGLVKLDGSIIGFIYWDDFNDTICLHKNGSGIRESLSFKLKDLKKYNSYTVTFIG